MGKLKDPMEGLKNYVLLEQSRFALRQLQYCLDEGGNKEAIENRMVILRERCLLWEDKG